jgi:RND family efflux transporter MFP subunit
MVWRVLLVIALCGMTACTKKTEVKEPPPPQVMVSHPLKKKITDYMVFSARTSAVESVEVRARVEGWLEKMHFEPGTLVTEDDLLFEIDARPFQAQVDQYEAMLMAKKADLHLARTNLKRAADLLAKQSISQLQYDEANAKALVAEAQVGIAEANLEKAKLDLAYTRVKAPISGQVSRNYVDVGNLVGAGEKTLLTDVVNNDKMYAYFDLSERDYLKLRRMYPREEVEPEDMPEIVPMHLQLADEQGFPHRGKLDFAEPQLDPGTGTLQARAIFDNTGGILLAGLFGRVRIPIQQREALLVPEMAIGMTQGGRYVMVVNKDNIVEQRLVTTGALKGTLRVIEKGLNKDDRVVVNAIQRARPGRPVTPKETPIKDQAKAAGPEAPAPAESPPGTDTSEEGSAEGKEHGSDTKKAQDKSPQPAQGASPEQSADSEKPSKPSE